MLERLITPWIEGLAAVTQLIVKNGVRERLGDHQVANEVYDALDDAVADLLDDAAERAAANGRSTIQARDL